MHESRRESFGFAIASALLGIFTLIGASKIEVGSSLGRGAEFLPKVVGWIFLLLALLFLIKGLLSAKEDLKEKTEKEYDKDSLLRFLGTIVLFVLYVLLFKSVGFIIMTAVFIFCQILLMAAPEDRKILPALAISIIVPIILYIIFGRLLHMAIPDGILSSLLY